MRKPIGRLTVVLGLAAILGIGLLPGAAWGQRNGPVVPLPLFRLGDGVYGIQGSDVVPDAPPGTMNTGVVVGDDGVFVFSCNLQNFESRVATIRTVTDKPIRWHANGHMASDDSGCNSEFRAMGATLLGSRAMRDHYLEWMPARLAQDLRTPAGRALWEGRGVAAPDITFEDELVLHLGEGRETHLIWMGTGHTVGDTVVYLPQQRVLFTADLLFAYLHPTARDGDTRNWQRILARMHTWPVDWIVPGHGPILEGNSYLQTQSTYFDVMRERVRTLMQQGLPVEDVISRIDFGEYRDWGRQNEAAETLEKIYHELQEEMGTAASQH
jgi:glyoxylase-like metal-dependent hydrolase (beta-lactamase superfamily II)